MEAEKVVKAVGVNDEFLDHVRKSKLVVIKAKNNFFDDRGNKQEKPVNMVFVKGGYKM